MNRELKQEFLKLVTNSLDVKQVNYLGETVDRSFNIYKESGFGTTIPLPRQTAAETLLHYFDSEEEIVELFTVMLNSEGERFYSTDLRIWEKENFMKLLEKNKWIFDPSLGRFFRDPFYEHEINFLNQIRVIDLRGEVPIEKIIKKITEVSGKLSIQDLEWRVTMRIYDLDRQISELIRKIIELLLVRQNLQPYAFEMFTCLKELAINASKANYKLLFEKFNTTRQGITAENDYRGFLDLFKEEIEEHGNSRLLELARDEDQYINIIFQSTNNSISIWVTNNANISSIEKKQILSKIKEGGVQGKKLNKKNENDFTEGAGLGIHLVMSILRKYTSEKEPLKVVFYPNFIKMGFELQRSELLANIEK